MEFDAEKRKAEIMESFKASVPKAEQDPTRPLYHFRAPGQWMDDPNGIIFHDGYYHLMYSCNPFDDAHRAGPEYKQEPKEEDWGKPGPLWNEGITCWGHARSRDLVHWEHLPVSIYPSEEKGEYFVWFGSTVIREDKTPICFYTSIGKTCGPIRGTTQWAATGTSDLLYWEKVPNNPVMPRSINAQEIFRWCDPHVFFADGRAYCLIGGKIDDPETGAPVICLYKALNPELTSWKYQGVLFRHPNKNLRSMECPNIVRMNGKWIIILSPHGPLEYWIGDLDPEACTFQIESMGFIDRGSHLYASNIMTDDKGRVLLWGAIEGFTENKGWRGCLNLPRVLSLDSQSRLSLQPASELESLRGGAREWRNFRTTPKWEMPIGAANTSEFLIEFEKLQNVTLTVSNRSGEAFRLTISGGQAEVAGKTVRFQLPVPGGKLTLHGYLDRTVIEIFLGGMECYTGVIQSETDVRTIALEGNSDVGRFHYWDLQAQDLFCYSYGEYRGGRFLSNGK